MKIALDLAKKGKGTTSPNPMVGAVVVKGNRIVGRGYHKKAGSPHAEVVAIKDAGGNCRNATLYITLEPCVHYGRTPPCVPLILKAGIKRVVIAMEDPNPLVKGKGIAALKEGGIEVEVGIREEEARKLNEFYLKYITTKLPFVIVKWAMSLDGKIATSKGESRWISGEESLRFVHLLRSEVDAILVGIRTVLIDNPRLTVRGLKAKRQPLRIVIDPLLEIPPSARCLTEEGGESMVVTSHLSPSQKREELKKKGVEVIICGEERVDLPSLLKKLGEKEITSLLVEGGGGIIASFLENKLVDKIYAIISPLLIGGKEAPTPFEGKGFSSLKDALHLKNFTCRRLGRDYLWEGYLDYTS